MNVEYAPSGRSRCCGCNRFIELRVIRIELMSENENVCRKYHLACLPHPTSPAPPFEMSDVTKGRGKLSREHKERMAECFATRGASEDDVRPTKLEEPEASKSSVGVKGKKAAGKTVKIQKTKTDKAKSQSGTTTESELAIVLDCPTNGLETLVQTSIPELQSLTKKQRFDILSDCKVQELQLLLRLVNIGLLNRGKDNMIDRISNLICDGLPPMCRVCGAKRLEHPLFRSQSWICTGGKFGFDPNHPGSYVEHGSPFKFIPCVGKQKIDKSQLQSWTWPSELKPLFFK